MRASLWYFYAGSERALYEKLDPGFQAATQTYHYLGITCLVIIATGLIVIWTLHIDPARSAWLGMFVIVWFWAFPVFIILPVMGLVLRDRLLLSLSEYVYDAITGSRGFRLQFEGQLMFLLMLIGAKVNFSRYDQKCFNALPPPDLSPPTSSAQTQSARTQNTPAPYTENHPRTTKAATAPSAHDPAVRTPAASP